MSCYCYLIIRTFLWNWIFPKKQKEMVKLYLGLPLKVLSRNVSFLWGQHFVFFLLYINDGLCYYLTNRDNTITLIAFECIERVHLKRYIPNLHRWFICMNLSTKHKRQTIWNKIKKSNKIDSFKAILCSTLSNF